MTKVTTFGRDRGLGYRAQVKREPAGAQAQPSEADAEGEEE